jgi:hypothetical protein
MLCKFSKYKKRAKAAVGVFLAAMCQVLKVRFFIVNYILNSKVIC